MPGDAGIRLSFRQRWPTSCFRLPVTAALTPCRTHTSSWGEPSAASRRASSAISTRRRTTPADNASRDRFHPLPKRGGNLGAFDADVSLVAGQDGAIAHDPLAVRQDVQDV